MKLHVTAFGAPAWERRRSILAEIIRQRPGLPRNFSDVLYLVANERTAYTLRAEFLDALHAETGANGCIPPVFDTLNRVLESRAASASGRPVVDRMTRLLVIEELTKSAAKKLIAGGLPPETIAPSAAPLIADALDKVYIYDVPGPRLAKHAEGSVAAELLAEVKRAYESWLKTHNLADPAAAKAAYRPELSEFEKYNTVVLDGFYDADPAETRLMKALAGSAEFVFILEAPGLSAVTLSGEGMPYHGTNELLDAIGFPAEGRDTGDASRDAEAGLVAGTITGTVGVRSARDMAEKMKPLASQVELTGAVNPAEEVWHIARSIKESYLKGETTDLSRVMVLFPELDPYLPELGRAFNSMGIPFTVSGGRPLSQSPVTTALMDLLALPVEDFAFHAVRKVLANPLITLSVGGSHAEAFARFGRAEMVTRGKDRWLERMATPRYANPEDAALVRPALTRLFELAGMLPNSRAKLADWAGAAKEVAAGSSIPDSVGRMAETRPELAAALDELVRVIDMLGEAARRLDTRMRAGEFLSLLSRSVSGRRYKTGGNTRTGVRVLGALEISSEPFDAIYAGGLTESAMPAPFRPDLFFPSTLSASLGIPSKEQARSREARRFLSIACGAPKVNLVYPQSVRKGPTPPSPYVRALGPLVSAGAVASNKDVTRPIDPAMALSPAELLRSAALFATVHGGLTGEDMKSLLSCLPEDTTGLSRALAAAGPPPEVAAPSPVDKTEFSVTELEDYMRCGFRYYHGRLLSSAPDEDPDDDIAPHRAGTIVHDILREFYEKAAGPVTSGNMDESLARLRGIAKEKFKALPDTTENAEFARRFVERVAPVFIETEAGLAGSGYPVRWTEKTIRLERTDEVAGSFVLKGKLDRLELSEDGEFTVVDYKTGRYPGNGPPLKDMFQLPLYAYMISEGAVETEGETLRPSRLVYYNLRDPKLGKMRDIVLYNTELEGDDTAGLHHTRKADAEGFRDRMDEAYNKASAAVRDIKAGKFEPTSEDKNLCKRCEFIVVCERGIRKAGDDEGQEGGSGED